MSKIVLGSSFGDEGKGLSTSFLCNEHIKDGNNPLVVRMNSGQQAGHTVVHEGINHVFSNFGSGTLQGVPTFWSEYCTISPIGILNEFNALSKVGVKPNLTIHPLCAVTTPYDRKYNCDVEQLNRHGSCGVGFGQTIQRQEDYYKLFVQDLFFENVLEQKLNNIRNYYAKKYSLEPRFIDNAMNIDINDFLYVINKIKDIIKVDNGANLLYSHPLVFEGAQGILLDQDFGFFPNVTRSNTTSKNALEIIKKYDVVNNNPHILKVPEIYYITRAYQTRHGNGYMSNEGLDGGVELKNNEKETNVTNEYQGKFRTSILDLDLLNYSLTCDNNFSKGLSKNLVITCVDQTGEYIKVTSQGSIKKMNVEEVSKHLNVSFDNVYVSRGSSMSDITLVK